MENFMNIGHTNIPTPNQLPQYKDSGIKTLILIGIGMMSVIIIYQYNYDVKER